VTAPDPGLDRKLSWLTFFRLVMVSVLLAGTALVQREGPDLARPLQPLYVLAGCVYGASALFALALRARWRPVRIAYAQIGLDVVVATVLVVLTGRAESLFLFLFLIAVVNGAILLFRRGAAAAGALVVAAYLGLHLRALGAPPVGAVTLFTHVASFVATAALAGYLAEQLRRTGEQLARTGEVLRRRESDLAALSALHGTVVQSMTAGLITLDRDGRVTFLNRVAEELTGVSLRDARGRERDALVPEFEREVGRGEVEHARPDGSRVRLGYSTFPLTDREGRGIGSAVLFQDLTRLREMEEAVQRSARLADLGAIAAGLAHELRNPLASMSGSIELLREHAGSEEDRRLMGIVLREAARLEALVAQFLAFARPATPRKERTDLRALLDETLRVFRNDPQAAGVPLEASLSPAWTECDPGQIRQVAWNLLCNAAQAMAGRPGAIRVACGEAPWGARLDVEDDGPGIPPDEVERIFLPFFTTKPRGTGLGLATVHRIVDAHGGTIAVTPAAGGGSRFSVLLPALRGEG
jgi:two-component system sensor histidine kinase PilS (NtrC family)